MALSKEDLQQIKLPLSDEDYVTLREEELRTNGEVWKIASGKLLDAYENKMIDCFDAHNPNNDADGLEIATGMWYPPQTEEYKDYPNYHQTGKVRMPNVYEVHT